MDPGYRGQIRQILADLIQRGAFQVRYDLPSTPTQENIDEFEEDVATLLRDADVREEFHIPQMIRTFGLYASNLQFFWEHTPICGKPAWGAVQVTHLFPLYAPLDAPLDEPDTPPAAMLQRHTVFDQSTQDTWVSARFERYASEPTLYYHTTQPNLAYRLNLSLEQYMQTVLETRGLVPWQVVFIDDPAFVPDAEQINLFYCQMEQLFPNANLARAAQPLH